jgi:hypothetical protein
MDNFTLKLKKGYEILDYKKIKSDFNNNLTVDSANVKIFFEQWRGNEILEYSFYIKTDIKKADTLLLEQPEFRQIIDGDIFFNKNELSNKKDRITQFIPQKYRLAGYVISMIFLGLFIIMLSMFIFLTPFSYYKINKWRANNESKYNSLIEKVFEDDSEKKDKLISNPDYAPDSFWEKFDGEKFPNVSVQLDMNKIYQPIIAVVIISIINISLIIAFMELIYLF